ncbi:MAG: hypothetical protein OXT07_15770 [bacterium]|nr:hypothetical protein [bacterium]
MTAEIAILNRAAIALAADSAVTLAADLKVYKTANKIFPLSLDPPIVIMFYGAGSLGSIPWETVVQEYKRTHSSPGFATVEESGADFIGFLPDMTEHISSRIQLEFVRTEIIWELEQLSRFAQANLASHVRTQPSTPSENLDYFLAQVREGVRARLNFLAELGPMDGLTDRVATRQFESALRNWELLGTRVDDWNGLLDLWFSQLPELMMHGVGYLTADIRQNLRAMAILSLRTADWSPDSTGVVVAGFGSEELFPSLTHWIVDQVMESVVKSRQLDCVRIDDDQPSAILPFAQQYEVARTLIDGIHPEFLDAHHDIVLRLLCLLSDTISEKIMNTVPGPMSTELVHFISTLPAEMLRTIPDALEMMIGHYSLPLLEVIGGLPKEHLGEMAETLVSLASFKEKFTPGADVVGGPIDVAVISRSDGLVWAKHKQYFEHEFGSTQTRWKQ